MDIEVTHKLGAFSLEVKTSWPLTGVTAIYGRSGAGKTTLINLIAGILPLQKGRIQMGEKIYADTARDLYLPAHKRQIGYVFQDARLFPHLSVEDNLLYGYRRNRSPCHIKPKDLIELLGIEHLLTRKPHHLSGGEQQRVAIGRALLAQPQLLLMDEPLSALDTQRRAELIPYIEKLRGHFRIPTLYISHTVDEVLRLADNCLLLDDGKLIKSGPAQEIFSDPSLSRHLGRFDAGAVIACTVAEHMADQYLSILSFDGGQLKVPMVELAIGTHLHTRIRARDVLLATEKPSGISANNCLFGHIHSLTPREAPFEDVNVTVGGVQIRALVTRDSIHRLALKVGSPVWALFKAAALESRAVGFTQRARVSLPASTDSTQHA